MRLPIFAEFLNRLELKEVGIPSPNGPLRMIGISSDKPSGGAKGGGRGGGGGGSIFPCCCNQFDLKRDDEKSVSRTLRNHSGVIAHVDRLSTLPNRLHFVN